MSRVESIRAAIVGAIQTADPGCPSNTIWDRFRDPKTKNRDEILRIFGEPVGDTQRIHGWHFKRTALPGYLIDSEEGHIPALTHTEMYSVEGFMSFVDAGETPSTYEWDRIMDSFAEAMFGSLEIQALQEDYNVTLTRVSIDNDGFTFLSGEMKCHMAQIALEFSILY